MPVQQLSYTQGRYAYIQYNIIDLTLLHCVFVQRPLYRHYYQGTDVIIFVIDSNDHERLPECKDELHRFLTEEELKDTVLLVLANKQDLPNAMSVSEIAEKLDLPTLTDRTWRRCHCMCTIYHYIVYFYNRIQPYILYVDH